jgi:hypothetical protein
MMSSRTSDKPGAWISRSAFLSLLDETAKDMGVKVSLHKWFHCVHSWFSLSSAFGRLFLARGSALRLGLEARTNGTDFIGRAGVHLWMRFLFAGQVWNRCHRYGDGGGRRRACADQIERWGNVQSKAASGLRR